MLKNRRHFFLFFTEIVFIRPLQTLSSISSPLLIKQMKCSHLHKSQYIFFYHIKSNIFMNIFIFLFPFELKNLMSIVFKVCAY